MLKLFKTPEKIIKYLIATILIFVPLYPKFPFLKIPGTYVSIRPEDFLILLLAIYLAISLFPKIKNILSGQIQYSIMVYLFVGLASLISAIFVTKSVGILIGILHWARRIEYFVPFLAGLVILKDRNSNTLKFFIKILMIVVVLTFIYGLGQRYLNWPVIITQNEEYAKGIALSWMSGSHINSTFAGHYDLASFLVMILPIFITSFFVVKGKTSKIMLFVPIVSGLWLLVNAVSRISIVSYLISCGFALFLAKKYKAIPIVIVVSLIFFSFSPDLRARYLRVIEVSIGRVRQMLLYKPMTVNAAEPIREYPTSTPAPVFEDRSTSIRLNVEWPRAIRAFSKNPILGTGYSSITLATDNDFLRLLGETGILGFLAFILIFIRIVLLIVKNFPLIKIEDSIEFAFIAGVIGSIPGLLLNAMFIDIFEASKFAIIFWLMIGLLVSLLNNHTYEQTS